MLYFQFSYAADLATQGGDGEQRLLALYASFRGWLSVAMLAMQLWLSGRLYRRLGLPLALALWPATYLVGFGWLGLAFALPAGMVSLGSARIMEDGLAGSALRILYNLFPDAERARASGLLEGPVNRLGGVAGNGLTLLAVAVGGAPWLGWLAFPAAVCWLVLVFVLWRSYPALLLRASADRSLGAAGADKAKLLDAGTLRALSPNLVDPDPKMCRAAIELVRDAEPALAVGLLAEAVERAPAGTRGLVVEALQRLVEPLAPGSLRSEPATRALARVLGGASQLPPEQRADLVQVYARLSGGEQAPAALTRESNALLERAMGDRAAPVRLAAIAELSRRGRRPPGVLDLDRALSGALVGPDMLMRRAARKELRAMLLSTSPDAAWKRRLALLAERLEQRSDRAETAEALLEVARRHDGQVHACAQAALRYRDDRDPRVRAALLALCGHAGLADEGPALVAALASRDPDEAQAAREGLAALGSAAAVPLLAGLGFGTASRRDAALSLLQELEVDSPTLEAIRRSELAALRHVVLMRAALEGAPAAQLLRRRLEERVREGVGALLALLAVLRNDPRLEELERRLRRTRDDRRRDLLIEGVEALLGAPDRSELVPLLESGRWAERGARASEALGRRLPEARSALAELRRDAEPFTRRLAEWEARAVEGEAPIGDAVHVLSPMEIAVKLQEMPAFDRLSTQQLLGLADVLQEQRAETGETIYAEGAEGGWLYFVLEGEVSLSKGTRRIRSLGPGAFFGEQSAIDGVPRALSARAETAARLLRLDREDLLGLMEEVPALAVGLAQFLSLELRKLQDALGR